MNNRLKVLRAERDWSQGDLAERLAVSRQSVNAIETGKYDPSLPLAFRIAELFDLPIEAIFHFTVEEEGSLTSSRLRCMRRRNTLFYRAVFCQVGPCPRRAPFCSFRPAAQPENRKSVTPSPALTLAAPSYIYSNSPFPGASA